MPTSKPAKLTARAYARHRGCDAKTVRKALAAGRITGERTEAGEWLIDAAAADIEWEQQTHPAHGGTRKKGEPVTHGGPELDAAPAAAPQMPPQNGTTPAPGATQQDDPDKIGPYNKSLAKEKHFKALMAEIEYQIEIGALVCKADNDKAVFAFHRTIRDRILNIPDRIAAVLAGEADREKVHGILSKELRQALTELADLAEQDDPAARPEDAKPASPKSKKAAT